MSEPSYGRLRTGIVFDAWIAANAFIEDLECGQADPDAEPPLLSQLGDDEEC